MKNWHWVTSAYTLFSCSHTTLQTTIVPHITIHIANTVNFYVSSEFKVTFCWFNIVHRAHVSRTDRRVQIRQHWCTAAVGLVLYTVFEFKWSLLKAKKVSLHSSTIKIYAIKYNKIILCFELSMRDEVVVFYCFTWQTDEESSLQEIGSMPVYEAIAGSVAGTLARQVQERR